MAPILASSGLPQPIHSTQAQRRSSVSDLLLTYDAILHYICNKNDMKPLPTEGYADLYFTTATIKGWKHLLKPDKYKMIVD